MASKKDTEHNKVQNQNDDDTSMDNILDALVDWLNEEEQALKDIFCEPSADSATYQRYVEKALAVVNDPQTECQELSDYLEHYNLKLEIAKAVARHPNCDDRLLARMLHWLPDDAQQNPKLQQAEYQNDEWREKVEQAKPSGAKTKSRWSYLTVINAYVNAEQPELFKVLYYLEHGKDSDRAYVLGLNKVPVQVCTDFLDSRSANVRKALAMREQLPDAGFVKLAQDKAKTIRLAVAYNPKATPDALALLCDDALPEIAQAAMNNPACPEQAVQQGRLKQSQQPKLHEKSADKLKLEEIRQLLFDRQTESTAIDNLSQHQDAWVRYASGLHPNASPQTLEKLADDAETWVQESVAFNANTPVSVLEMFAQRSELSIKQALAANPATPESLQLKLAEFGNNSLLLALLDQSDYESVWHKVLETCKTKQDKKQKWQEYLALLLDPETKAGKLRNLSRGAQSRHLFVQRMIARHPNCAPSLKGQFAQYCYSDLVQNPSIALEILENPQAITPEPCADWIIKEWGASANMPGHVSCFFLQGDDSILARLAIDSWTSLLRDQQRWVLSDDIHVRKRIVNKCSLNRFMFEALAHDPKASVRELIAKKKTRFAKSAQHLVNDKSTAVRAALVQNKSVKNTATFTAETLEVANKGPKRQRIKLAKEATDSKILSQLVEDRAIEVKRAVAQNRKTGPKALQLLFEQQQDGDQELCLALARHPKTPLSVLEALTRYGDANTRRVVATHQTISHEQIRHLLDDCDPMVRHHALRRFIQGKGDQYVFIDEVVMHKMSQDEDERVRSLVAKHVHNQSVQQRFANDASSSVRVGFAANPYLEETIAQQLAADSVDSVRRTLSEKTSYFSVLRLLLDDDDRDVANNIGRNDRLSKQQRLALTEECLALNTSQSLYAATKIYRCLGILPEESICLRFAQHDNYRVRNFFLNFKRKKLPKTVLQALLENPTPGMATTWMTELTEEQLICLAKHADSETRNLLASYSDDTALLLFLASDTDEVVRQAVSYNESINDEIRSVLAHTA